MGGALLTTTRIAWTVNFVRIPPLAHFTERQEMEYRLSLAVYAGDADPSKVLEPLRTGGQCLSRVGIHRETRNSSEN